MRSFIRRLMSLGPGRGAFVVVMLVLAAFSGHPGGGVMSGALDRAMFDAMAQVVAKPSTGQVVVVNIDNATARALGMPNLPDYSARFFARVSEAGSVVLDLPLTPGIDYSSLEAGMRAYPRTLLIAPSTLSDATGGFALPLLPRLAALAAARSQRVITIGHYGVVTGFIPYRDAPGSRLTHVAIDAPRVAGIAPKLPVDDYMQPYAFSINDERTRAVMTMLPRRMNLPQYAYLDVVQGKVPASAFAGKVVFVGHQAWLGEGTFQTSSLDTHAVSRAQLDALLTDAVAVGNLVREAPSSVEVPIYLALAAGIVLICLFMQGRAMHLAAIGWGVLLFAVPLAMLAFHIWLPLGLLPFVCLLIYGFFAWDRHSRTLALLRRELTAWRAIAASIRPAGAAAAPAMAPAASAADELAGIQATLRQVRGWQKLYVDMINQLPYPVFLAMDGKVAVWNAKAAALIHGDTAAPDALAHVEQLVADSVRMGSDITREIDWGGRAHMLLCEPLSTASAAPGEPSQATHLICLVDIADVKALVSHDKRMLRHVAHDLRSPLTAILSLIDRRDAMDGGTPVTQSDRAFLQDLRQQAAYSLRIAKDFMQLSRAERLDRAEFEPVALATVVGEAIDQIWLAAEQKQIDVREADTTIEDTLVDGNADMLMRAVVNVIDNAIKYSPSGTRITVSIDAPGDGRLALRVSDQGIGMTDDTVQRLFEPFFQAERKGDASGGVGLGLPFVKAVVERHGGTIEVTSEPGRGTVFAIVLPRAVSRPAELGEALA